MATATTNVQLNVTGNAQQQLSKIEKQVDALNGSFGKLKTALGGLAIGAFVGNLFKFADGIADASKATNIATNSVLGFGAAVQASGGDMESAINGLNKFNQTIAEANDKGGEARQAFDKIGVSLEDLRTLSEEDLLRKTLDGIAQVGNASERARLQVAIFGKTLKGIDAVGLAAGFKVSSEEMKKYNDTISSAEKAQEKLEYAIMKFKLEVLNALKPFIDFLNKLDKKTIDAFAKGIAELAVSLGTLATALKSIQLAAGLLVGSFTMMKKGAKTIGDTSKTSEIQAKGFAKALENASGIIQIAGVVIAAFGYRLKNLGYLLGGLIRFLGPLYAVSEVLARIFSGGEKGALDYLGDLIDKVRELLGLQKEVKKFDARKFGYREATKKDEKVVFPESANRDQVDPLKKQKAEILGITEAYKKQNDELVRNINNQMRSYTVSQDALENITAQEQVYYDAIETIEQLTKMKAALTKEEKALAPIIDAQIASIENNLAANQERVSQSIIGLQQLRHAEEDLLKSIEDTSRAFTQAEAMQDLQDQLSLIGLYGEELEKQKVILEAEKALREEMQRLSIELLKLEADRVKLGEEAYNKERARVVQQMMDTKALSEAKIKTYEEEQAKKQKIDESYAEGATRAMKDIAEQFKPINMAQEAVQKGWGKISDAIDNFVQTGKFSFSDFARSVIADLAKMIAKAMIFKAISAALGAFGLKLPGMASGGPVEAGKGYIVGEKGPELFVPPGSGKIVPNKDLQGNGKGSNNVAAPVTNNYNTYNISALDAKSVAQMFAENRKAIFGANKMAEREMSYAGAR